MIRLTVVLLAVFSGASLVACKPQDIDRDVTHWPTYRTNINGIELSFKLPPDGKIFAQPPSKIDVYNLNKDESYSSFAYIGYDYGSKSSDQLSQFHLGLGLGRYTEPINREITVEELVDKTEDERKQLNIMNYEVVKIDGKKWFYEEIRGGYGGYGESYSVPLNNTHYLSFGGSYSDDILKNKEWFADRKNLLKDIVSTVTMKQR